MKLLLSCLLCLLPLVAIGQTSASYQREDARVRVVKKCPGDTWWTLLRKGGMVRNERGDWYLKMPEGLNEFSSWNFVDGHALGPQATMGHFGGDRSRWELDESVRWSFSRETWMAKGALRWYSPIEQSAMIELHGGQYTEDFDRDPTMTRSLQDFAAALFAWNHGKLLERTDAGLRAAFPLSNDLMFRVDAGWERRRRMENHRPTSIFGAHPQSNEPRLCQGRSAQDLVVYDGPIDGQLGRVGVQLEYTPQAKHYVFDDMTCETATHLAVFGVDAELGAGSWHYASLNLHVKQSLPVGVNNDLVRYFVSCGGILKHGELGLADWHHFDASTFFWQMSNKLSRFALLDPYELSTDEAWVEGHVEWNSGNLLLSRWAKQPGILDEYVQLHAVKVPGHRAHYEAHYGINLMQTMRLGVAMGWDDLKWRGMLFTMSLDVFKAAKMK